MNPFSKYLLCLPDRDALVVVSVVVILVTYAGAVTWTVVRFLVDFWLESRGAGVGSVDLMRVASRTPSTSWSMLEVYIRGVYLRIMRRQHSEEGWVHIVLMLILSLFYSIGFLTLSIFTPGLVSQRTATLYPTNCGYWVYNTSDMMGASGSSMEVLQLSQLAQFISNGSSSALAWIDACYGSDMKSSHCDTLSNGRILWDSKRANCPFKGQCVGGDDGTAFTMTTGDITVRDFGINTKSKLTLKRESICAPIVMEPYRVEVTETKPVGGYAHLTFNGQNATQIPRSDSASPYMVSAWYPQPGMVVHPNLQAQTGNVSIIYISRNDLIHLHRTADPIFSATQEIPVPLLNITGYLPKWEERLGSIACVEKLQLCNDFGRGRECSPWTGVVRGENGEVDLGEFYEKCGSEDKGMIGLLFPRKLAGLTVGHTASGAGSNIAAARSLLMAPGPGGLWEMQTADGEEQWKAEVSQWFDIVLASMQLAVLYFPTSPPFLDTSLLVNEMLPESRFICTNVLVNTTKHTSIRYLGVVTIVGWSLLATGMSWWIRRRWEHWSPDLRQTAGAPSNAQAPNAIEAAQVADETGMEGALPLRPLP